MHRTYAIDRPRVGLLWETCRWTLAARPSSREHHSAHGLERATAIRSGLSRGRSPSRVAQPRPRRRTFLAFRAPRLFIPVFLDFSGSLLDSCA
jgi:hypothetical protein